MIKGKTSADEDLHDSSSDDEKIWAKEVQKKYRMLKRNERQRELEEKSEEELEEKDSDKKTKFYEIKESVQFTGSNLQIRKKNK